MAAWFGAPTRMEWLHLISPCPPDVPHVSFSVQLCSCHGRRKQPGTNTHGHPCQPSFWPRGPCLPLTKQRSQAGDTLILVPTQNPHNKEQFSLSTPFLCLTGATREQ